MNKSGSVRGLVNPTGSLFDENMAPTIAHGSEADIKRGIAKLMRCFGRGNGVRKVAPAPKTVKPKATPKRLGNARIPHSEHLACAKAHAEALTAGIPPDDL